jgi:hypothetical protein
MANELLWGRIDMATQVAQHGTQVVSKTALPIVVAAMMVMFGSTAPSFAQTTAEEGGRASELSTERESKAQQLEPPRRSLIERALNWYDNHGLRLGWRALHFSAGIFPKGAGFGYGIGLSERAMGSPVVDPDQPNRIDGSLIAARTLRGYQQLAARMDMRNLSGGPADLFVSWQEYQLPQEDFYGLGAGSASTARTNYRLDGTDVAGGFTWRPAASLSLTGELSYLTPFIGVGTDPRYASTQSMYADADVPGLSDLPSFVRTAATAGYDWRDSQTHPRRGGSYRATFARFSGVNDEQYNFDRVDASAQQIIPLPNRYRRIELRAGAAFTQAADGADVPFIYQPVVGGAHTLRGYSESRFRDRNAVWAAAEYQWEAWWALDGAIFIDAGQVAATRSAFSLRDFDVTYGFGLRLHGHENFLARLDLAYGREGFHPILGFTYGF